MKVVIITPYLNGWGGTEKVLHNTFAALNDEIRENKIQMQLYTLGESEDLHWLSGTDAKQIPLFLPIGARRAEYLVRLIPILISIIGTRPDIVISTNSFIWQVLHFLRRFSRTHFAIVSWYHFSLNMSPISRGRLNKADYFLAISTSLMRQFIDRGVPNEKIYRLPNPVFNAKDTSLIKTTHSNDLIYIGRFDLDQNKNLSEILRAVAKSDNLFQLHVYGQGEDLPQLVKLSKKLNINQRVHWHGFVPNLWDNINSARCLILSSKMEALPTVLIEALAHGIPVISTESDSATIDIVDSGRNGLLYQSGDVNGLANAIRDISTIELYDRPEQLRQTVSKFEFDSFKEEFMHTLSEINND